MNRSVIVAKIEPAAEREVAAIWAESDRTELPHIAGVLHRSLYRLGDLYVHFLETDQPGASAVEAARRHPEFARVSEELSAYITPYLATWKSPRDARGRGGPAHRRVPVTATTGARTRGSARNWTRCTICGVLHYVKKLARSLGVCPDCGYHYRLPAGERIAQLTDPGSFLPLGISVAATDTLRFTDSQPYPARLAKARAATGLDDAVLAGTARIAGHPLAIATMDFAFMGGSLGAAVGEVLTLTAEKALSLGVPFLVVSASGGARMQEGAGRRASSR